MSAQDHDGEQRLYVFSSASRPLYKQNVLDNVASPPGYILHYRYETKHVGDPLMRRVTDGGPFEGMRGLVIFVDQVQDQDDSLSVESFYPLRDIEVREVVLDGSVLHVFFKVGRYVSYGSEPMKTRREYSDRLEDNLKGAGLPTQKYVTLNPWKPNFDFADTTSKQQQAKAWSGLVELLENVETFETSVFFRVPGVRQQEGLTKLARAKAKAKELVRRIFRAQPADYLSVQEVLTRRSGYELRSGHNYALELTFYRKGSAEAIEGSTLVPVLDNTYFRYDPEPILVRFRYDNHDIDLVTTPVTQDALTRLQLKLEHEGNESAKGDEDHKRHVSAPQPSFALRLKAPRYRIWGFLLFLFGNLLTALSPVIPVAFESALKTSTLDSLQAVSAVVGPTLFSVGLLILYRTLR